MTKRDVSNQTLTLDVGNSTNEEKKDAPLSDNISLFQSLRVLQEGEGDELNEIRSKQNGAITELIMKIRIIFNRDQRTIRVLHENNSIGYIVGW